MVIIIALGAVSCKKTVKCGFEDTSVKMSFENVSGENLQTLTVSDVVIGDLAEGESSDFFKFDDVMTMGDWPLLTASCEANHVATKKTYGFCATGAEYLENGCYTVEVDITENGDNKFVALKMK